MPSVIPDTLPALLAARAPRATALIDRGRPISFGELRDVSGRVAHGLDRLGVRAGDRVALWLPNVPAWLASLLACAQLGAIAVSLNTRFRGHELADILPRSRARVLVFWPGFKGIDFAGLLADCAPSALEGLEAIVAYDESGASAARSLAGKPVVAYAALARGARLLESRAAPEAGCVIFTTSGTTQAPKFVLHDQRSIIAHAFDVVKGFSIDDASVLLLAPPLCGVFGFCSAMAALAAGRPLVMAPAWNAEDAARDIASHRVTHANGTDEAFAQLLAVERASFSSTRFFGYAAFDPALGDVVARARDPETRRDLAHGEPGELEFFAPASRMIGYHGDPGSTRAALTEDGFYRSGDLGYTLADGRFVYLARLGDSLRLGGFLVSPAEIEAVMQEAPGIAACQVVGVRLAGGPAAVAFVVLEAGCALDEPALIAHAAARLARYKVPRRVLPIAAFPVTPGANATKIRKGKLRELAVSLLN